MDIEQKNRELLEEQEDFIRKSLAPTFDDIKDEIIKGKRAQMGEVREWGGVKMRKEANGWIPVKEDVEKPKAEGEGGGEQKPQDIGEAAKSASEGALQNAIKLSNDPKVREAAHRELERRKNEEATDTFKAPDGGEEGKKKERVEGKNGFTDKSGEWHDTDNPRGDVRYQEKVKEEGRKNYEKEYAQPGSQAAEEQKKEDKKQLKKDMEDDIDSALKDTHNDSNKWREGLFNVYNKFKDKLGLGGVKSFIYNYASSRMDAGPAYRAEIYIKSRVNGNSKEESFNIMKKKWKEITGKEYREYKDDSFEEENKKEDSNDVGVSQDTHDNLMMAIGNIDANLRKMEKVNGDSVKKIWDNLDSDKPDYKKAISLLRDVSANYDGKVFVKGYLDKIADKLEEEMAYKYKNGKSEIKKSLLLQNIENEDLIEKSHINEFVYSEDMKVSKTGKELKEKFQEQIKGEVEEIREYSTKIQELLQKIGEQPTKKVDEIWYYRVDGWEDKLPILPMIFGDGYASINEEGESGVKSSKYEYDQLVGRLIDCNIEIIMLNTMINNMKDSKEYKLTVRQAAMLGF